MSSLTSAGALPPILGNLAQTPDGGAVVLQVLAARAVGDIASPLVETLLAASGPGKILSGTVDSAQADGTITLLTRNGTFVTLHHPPELTLAAGSNIVLRVIQTAPVPQAAVLAVNGRPIAARPQAPGAAQPVPQGPSTASPTGTLPLTSRAGASNFPSGGISIAASLISFEDETAIEAALSGDGLTLGATASDTDAVAGPTVIATLVRPAPAKLGQTPLPVGTRYLVTVTEVGAADSEAPEPSPQAPPSSELPPADAAASEPPEGALPGTPAQSPPAANQGGATLPATPAASAPTSAPAGLSAPLTTAAALIASEVPAETPTPLPAPPATPQPAPATASTSGQPSAAPSPAPSPGAASAPPRPAVGPDTNAPAPASAAPDPDASAASPPPPPAIQSPPPPAASIATAASPPALPQQAAPSPTLPAQTPDDLADFQVQVSVLAGRVVPARTDGETLVSTAVGTLSLPLGETLPTGSAIQLKVAAVAPPAVRAAPLGAANATPPAAAARSTLIEETSSALAAASANFGSAIQTALAFEPGTNLAAALFGFLAGVQSGRPPARMLDPPLRKALLEAGRGDLAGRLDTAAQTIGTVRSEPARDGWTVTVLPFLGSLSSEPMRLYRKAIQDRDAEGKLRTSQRFVLELELQRLGPLQFDGMVRERRFDLVLRSTTPLAPDLQEELKQIFRDGMMISGWAGELGFGRAGRYPLVPLLDRRPPVDLGA